MVLTKNSSWQSRLLLERDGLKDRLQKLETFQKSDFYQKMPVEDVQLLLRQSMFMEYYLNILDQRINRME